MKEANRCNERFVGNIILNYTFFDFYAFMQFPHSFILL